MTEAACLTYCFGMVRAGKVALQMRRTMVGSQHPPISSGPLRKQQAMVACGSLVPLPDPVASVQSRWPWRTGAQMQALKAPVPRGRCSASDAAETTTPLAQQLGCALCKADAGGSSYRPPPCLLGPTACRCGRGRSACKTHLSRRRWSRRRRTRTKCGWRQRGACRTGYLFLCAGRVAKPAVRTVLVAPRGACAFPVDLC